MQISEIRSILDICYIKISIILVTKLDNDEMKLDGIRADPNQLKLHQ